MGISDAVYKHQVEAVNQTSLGELGEEQIDLCWVPTPKQVLTRKGGTTQKALHATRAYQWVVAAARAPNGKSRRKTERKLRGIATASLDDLGLRTKNLRKPSSSQKYGYPNGRGKWLHYGNERRAMLSRDGRGVYGKVHVPHPDFIDG